MRRMPALLLVLLLAGCTRAPDATLPDPIAQTDASPLPVPFVAPAPSAVDRIGVALSLDERWLRPADPVVANATASARSFEWYLASRNPVPRASAPAPVTIQAQDTQALDVRRAGRHGFAVDGAGARLNVSILQGALPLRLDVRLLEDDEGLRFAPNELVGGPGSIVSLVNERPLPVDILRVDTMMPLPSEGRAISFLLPDHVAELGDYDLVVVARDGSGAVGVASARIIYDNRKPEPERTFGPFQGRVLHALPGQAAPLRFDWTSAHPMLTLDTTLVVTSESAAPASVRLSLMDAAGDTLASTEGAGFSLVDLPAGEFSFLLEPLGGVLVDYKIEASAVWDLQPPESFFRQDG